MKKPSVCFLVALVLVWNQTLVAGFSDPGAAEGYFRFLDSGDDPGDEPRDEYFSFIPDFVPHFHTIGFPKISTDPYVEKDYFDTSFDIVKNAKDLKREAIPEDDHTAEEDDPHICIVHESKSGAQLWGALCLSHGIFSGLFPHYLGKSRVPLCILSARKTRFWDPEKQKPAGHLFGTVLCTFDHSGDALKFLKNDDESRIQGGITVMDSTVILPGKGVAFVGKGFFIPETREGYNIFQFHCHNLAFKEDSSNTPLATVAQLSGFADKEVFCYDSFEDFEAWSKEFNRDRRHRGLKTRSSESRKKIDEDDTRFSSQFFGTETKKGSDKHAMIVGHVAETEIKTNEHTGEVFVWALIRTSKDMEIDVVFRQSLLESRGSPMPKVGGVLRGHFWLSGILMLDGANEYM